jgi:ribonuclease PH
MARGDHSPGEEVDIAVIYDDASTSEAQVKAAAVQTATSLKEKTNISVVPFCISRSEMGRRGGLGSELRDKETIWKRPKGRQ